MMQSGPSAAQQRAADPAISTWLSANAGSGKTKVLIDRVARLLLSGVSPQHILCLTYTKAAATEMQNRLFGLLGKWAMMAEADLRHDLAALGHSGGLTKAQIDQARQLFARAIESPGGLRIQTIHSFCATLLRRFPLEAGVSPAFQEMDERAARLLREAIIEDMAETTAKPAVDALAKYHSGQDFLGLMTAVARNSDGFARALTMAQCKAKFGLSGNETEQGIAGQVLLGGEEALIAGLLPALSASTEKDQKAAKLLARIQFQNPSAATLAALESVLLFKSGARAFQAKTDEFPTKPVRLGLDGAALTRLNNLMLRVESARPTRIALEAAEKTAALHEFAAAFLPLYDAAKAARGLLDFDDLIARTIHLLTDRSVAAWVLFRLDGGIDHILVDEAQDTSPKQWRVIELLTQEITAGQGAGQRPRSLFVVGDKKQSIYSFQGADVAVFDEKRRQFSADFAAAGQPFEPLDLVYSFRSSPAILRVVDNVFQGRFPRAMGEEINHIAFRDGLAGRVDLWPVYEKPAKDDALNPTDTAAQLSANTADWQLAQDVARQIGEILNSDTVIPTKDGPKIAGAGDILVLVRRRSHVFHHIIRACKKRNLPIAGADRLRLGGEMAVRDITAALRFLATPEDDLSLAAALRSPLFGLTEAQLFDLAQGRQGYLWQALRDSRDHAAVMAMITDLRDQSDYLRPYDLIERMLTRHDGRRRLIARLGPEAEEGIDEMLSQALAFEQGEIPSLTGFLLWLDTDEITIKRQLDSTGAQIRVMTVHGAKGLEAPIVILPDTSDLSSQDKDEIVPLEDGSLAWKVNDEARPAEMQRARAQKADAEADESLRLLYVALTRAQSWLIVAAAGMVAKEAAWYNLIQQGMMAAGSTTAHGGVLRHEFGDWPMAAPPVTRPGAVPAALPDWAAEKAAPAQRPAMPFAPSRLSGAKTLAGEGDGDQNAIDFGSAVHSLLEHLPNLPMADWPAFADRMTFSGKEPAFTEARRVLTAPDLRHVFDSPLAEVVITAPLDKGQMLGVIDRLVITAGAVLAVDFKTNSVVPRSAGEVPAGILAQQAAYCRALQQVYPEKRIDMAILWTKTAQLMPLDHEMMRAAYDAAAIS